MRILLTNDDGIGADGLAALRTIAYALSDDVWTVAPEVEQSGASRALTLSEPVRVRKLDERTFAVSGTPTDCVRLALTEIVTDKKPDLVLSGVNRGQNLGEDVSMSGTVAGAIEGMMWGVPSIALSQSLSFFRDDIVIRYENAEAHAPGIIAKLLEIGWPREVVINLNFPDLPAEAATEVELAVQGRHDMAGLRTEKRTDLRGRDYYWLGFTGREARPDPGTDLAAIEAGKISVTPLHIDLTHKETLARLKGKLGGPPPKLASRG
jgi:5'-nucleotidase